MEFLCNEYHVLHNVIIITRSNKLPQYWNYFVFTALSLHFTVSILKHPVLYHSLGSASSFLLKKTFACLPIVWNFCVTLVTCLNCLEKTLLIFSLLNKDILSLLVSRVLKWLKKIMHFKGLLLMCATMMWSLVNVGGLECVLSYYQPTS